MIGFLAASLVLNIGLICLLWIENKRTRLYMEDRLWWKARAEALTDTMHQPPSDDKELTR